MKTGDERRYSTGYDAGGYYVVDRVTGDKIFSGGYYHKADRLRHELERSWDEMRKVKGKASGYKGRGYYQDEKTGELFYVGEAELAPEVMEVIRTDDVAAKTRIDEALQTELAAVITENAKLRAERKDMLDDISRTQDELVVCRRTLDIERGVRVLAQDELKDERAKNVKLRDRVTECHQVIADMQCAARNCERERDRMRAELLKANEWAAAGQWVKDKAELKAKLERRTSERDGAYEKAKAADALASKLRAKLKLHEIVHPGDPMTSILEKIGCMVREGKDGQEIAMPGSDADTPKPASGYKGRGYYQDNKTGKVVYIADVRLSNGLLEAIRADGVSIAMGDDPRLAELIDDVQVVIDTLRPVTFACSNPQETLGQLCSALKKARRDHED